MKSDHDFGKVTAQDLRQVRAVFPLHDLYSGGQLYDAMASSPRLLEFGRCFGWDDPRASEWLATALGASRRDQQQAGLLLTGDGPDADEVRARITQRRQRIVAKNNARRFDTLYEIRRYPWGWVQWRQDPAQPDAEVELIGLNKHQPRGMAQKIGHWFSARPISATWITGVVTFGIVFLLVFMVLGPTGAFGPIGLIANVAGLAGWLGPRQLAAAWSKRHAVTFSVPPGWDPTRLHHPTMWDCLTRAITGAERLRAMAPDQGSKIDHIMTDLANTPETAWRVAAVFAHAIQQADQRDQAESLTASTVISPHLDHLTQDLDDDIRGAAAGNDALRRLDNG